METATLYPKRGKTVLLAAVGAVFTVTGMAMIADGRWAGWLVALFFGLVTIVLLVNCLPRASWLHLNEQGFSYATMFKVTSLSWEDVDHFYPRTIGGNAIVGIEMSASFLADKGAMFKGLADSTGGALPDTYGLSGEELATRMNEQLAVYRQQN